MQAMGSSGRTPPRTDRVVSRFCPGRVFLWSVVPLLLFLASGCERKQEAPPPAPLTVDVVPVLQKDVPLYSEWVGTTDGFLNATIRAQVTGYLIRQNYKEGSLVKAGDLLFEIDPRPFKAVLDQAEGQLGQAKANLGKTEQDVKRYRPLAKESAISQQELDDAIQANLASKAAVSSAEAAVEQARVNLGFTRITSPINGIAGIANAQIGDLVGPGQTGALTTVSTVDPIRVYFPISEQEYMEVAEKIAVTGTDQAARGEGLELILANGSVYPHKGKFFFANREVEVQTGTIRIAALFPNPGNLLRPGQFAQVRALTTIKRGALLVPQRAVKQLQSSTQVAVVSGENKVEIRDVKAGARVNGLWIIDGGLEPGERVVTEGLQKVRDGEVVNPRLSHEEFQSEKPSSRSAPASGSESTPSPTPTSRDK